MAIADHFAAFFGRGWTRFPVDSQIAKWAEAVRPLAEHILATPDQRQAWLRCGGTWFAGVNVLPNDDTGGLPAGNVSALGGEVIDFALSVLDIDVISWDRAQISVCFEGYPEPWEGESPAAFRFRRDRDAAHVDGLMRSDPGRRRFLGETHGFILGVPLNETPEDAAPMVVWEGSHEIMRRAFRQRFHDIPPGDWSAEDLTDAYTEARRLVFETCPRVAVHARPGEAYLVHRLALHGIAPWGAAGGIAPRMIAYLRPDPFPGASPEWWIERP